MLKKTLAASAVLMTGLSLSAFGAASNFLSDQSANHWYVNGLAGANFQSDSTISDRDEDGDMNKFEQEYNTGYNLGAALGYRFDNHFRLEGELAYLHANLKEVKLNSYSTDESGHSKAIPLMLNGYYDFTQLSPQFVPYVGVGVGYLNLNSEAKLEGFTSTADKLDTNANLFAYQGIVGLGYHINNDMIVSLDYRYLATNNAKVNIKLNGDDVGHDHEKYENNLVNLGFTYYFA